MLVKNTKEASRLIDTYLSITERQIRKAKRQLKRGHITITPDSIVTLITDVSIHTPLCASADMECDKCIFSVMGLPTDCEPHPCKSISHSVLNEIGTDPKALKQGLYSRAMYIGELGFKADVCRLSEPENSLIDGLGLSSERLTDLPASILEELAEFLFGKGAYAKLDSIIEDCLNGKISGEEMYKRLDEMEVTCKDLKESDASSTES
jgi:hypothetical protein